MLQLMTIVVLSLGRTASVSVWKSLEAATSEPVLHAHYLDSSRWRDPDKPRSLEKAEKEAAVVSALADASQRRVIVSVLRDPFDRIASALWYEKPQAMAHLFRKVSEPSVAEVLRVLRHRMAVRLEKQRMEWEVNWARLGLIGYPAPGLMWTRSGIPVHFLAFERLAAGFATATMSILGVPAPLLKLNTGEDQGDAAAHARFRSWCDDHLVELIREADAGVSFVSPAGPERRAQADPPGESGSDWRIGDWRIGA